MGWRRRVTRAPWPRLPPSGAPLEPRPARRHAPSALSRQMSWVPECTQEGRQPKQGVRGGVAGPPPTWLYPPPQPLRDVAHSLGHRVVMLEHGCSDHGTPFPAAHRQALGRRRPG